MSAPWTWTYLDADGATLSGGELPAGALPCPGEAESRLRCEGAPPPAAGGAAAPRRRPPPRGRHRALRADEPASVRVSAVPDPLTAGLARELERPLHAA